MTQQSNTPETDANQAMINRQTDYGMSGYVSADFARKLELERNEARRALA